MSAGDVGQIIDVDGAPEAQPGHDRRGALVLAFAMCVAIGGAAVGRDGPEATAPIEPPRTLVLSRGGDAVLFAFPDRLANEPLPNLPYMTVVVRGTEGLALNTGGTFVRDDISWGRPPTNASHLLGWLVTWTEDGTVYTLTSNSSDLSDLLRVAGSLR